MRVLVGLCVLAACGSAAPRAPAKVSTASAQHDAARLTPHDMLRAFPASTSMLFVIDAHKLRKSPLVMRAWDALGDVPKVTEFLASLCGVESSIDYVLLALAGGEPKETWAWMRGVARTDKLDCAKSREEAKANETTQVVRGDYVLETSKKGATEMLWVDPTTMFMRNQEPSVAPVSETLIRHAVTAGAGFMNAAMFKELFEHLDFDSGAAIVLDGAAAQQPGIRGLAISVEADEGLRLQIYALFDNEDRASELQAEYRGAISMLLSKQLIESGEARANGTGMSASVTLSGAQADWWMQFALTKFVDAHPPAAGQD